MAIASAQSTAQPYAIPEFRPVLGYGLAALFCIVAGVMTTSPRQLPSALTVYQLFAFGAYIIPIYINRAILYEQRNINAVINEGLPANSHLTQLSWTIVWTIILCNTIWFIITLSYSQETASTIYIVLIRVISAVIPFYVFMYWGTLRGCAFSTSESSWG